MGLFPSLGKSLVVLGCLHSGTSELGHKTLLPPYSCIQKLPQKHPWGLPGSRPACRQKNLPVITEILGNTFIMTRFFPSSTWIKKPPSHCHWSTSFFLTSLFLMGTHGISHLLPFPWDLVGLQFKSCNNTV